MNPYTKAAQFVVRLIGAGFVVVSLALLSGNAVLALTSRPTEGTGALVLEGMPLLIGVALLWKSTALAKTLTRNLGEDE